MKPSNRHRKREERESRDWSVKNRSFFDSKSSHSNITKLVNMSQTDTINDDEEEEMETDVSTKNVVTQNRSMNDDDEDVRDMRHFPSLTESGSLEVRNGALNDDEEMEMENDDDLTKNVVTKTSQ